MKQFNLDLPYKAVKADDRKTFPANKHITEWLLRTLVQVRYPQGMNGTDADIWADIADAMDQATSSDNLSFIDIEKSAVLWLLAVVNWVRDNSKIPAIVAPWTRTLLDELEDAKKRGEPKLEAIK